MTWILLLILLWINPFRLGLWFYFGIKAAWQPHAVTVFILGMRAGYSRCWGDSHLESRWGKGLQATNALNMEQVQLPTFGKKRFGCIPSYFLSEGRKVLWDALSSQRLRIAIHWEFLKMRGPKVIQMFFPRFEKHSAHAFLILATLQKLSNISKKNWLVTNYPHIPHSYVVSD